VIDQILREFSLLQVFSCIAPRRQKYNMGSKLAEKNHEQDPCHKILIDGVLREIISPKGKSSHFYKIMGHMFQSQMVKQWKVGGLLGLE
jgi:hypothetical protein